MLVLICCAQPAAKSDKAKLISRMARMGQPMLPVITSHRSPATEAEVVVVVVVVAVAAAAAAAVVIVVVIIVVIVGLVIIALASAAAG